MRALIIACIMFVLIQPAVSTPLEEVIITSEKLVQQAEELKEFHQSLGVESEIVTVEDIWAGYPQAEDPPIEGYATGAHSDRVVGYNYTLAKKIISFLRNCSAEYVTIFGDADVVPPSYYSYNRWKEELPTDYLYADPDYDMHAEFAVGRLPVSNADEAEKIVSKIKTWYSGLDEGTFSKAVVVGTNNLGGTHGLLPGGVAYIEDVEAWQGELAAVHVAEHLQRFDCTLYMQSDGSRDRIKAALDDAFSGRYGLVVHFGHGSSNGISIGGMLYTTRYLAEVGKLGDVLPVVMSAGCKVAAYDDELLTEDSWINRWLYEGHTFSEMLLLHDAGGIAFIGFTRSTTLADYFYHSSHVTQEGYADNGFVSIDDDVRFAAYIVMQIADKLGTGRSLGEVFRDALNEYINDSAGPTYLLLEAELLGDPTLQLPALVQKNTPKPEVTVESQPVSIERPCRSVNGERYCDGSIPKFVGGVDFSFDEPVVVKVFNLESKVSLLLKVDSTSALSFSHEESGKYLLRASNGKRETWYVFYFEPGESGLEITYPEQVETEVGQTVTVEIGANVESAECRLVSAPSGAKCRNLTFTWTPTAPGNYTVDFVVSGENSTVNGSFVIIVHPLNIKSVYPENHATGIELSPVLNIRVNASGCRMAEFYTDSGELIGVSVIENGYASVEWGELEPGKMYGWYVVVRGDGCEATSDIFNFRTSFVPEADFEYRVSGSTVTFTSLSTDADGQSLSCLWDFGDGSHSEGCELTHEYDPGNYSVTLRVTDTTNLSDSITKHVTVTIGQSPTSGDLDGDGLYEDVNGDGALTFEDVTYLREHLEDLQVQYYDFNPDCKLNSMDALRLYAYWKWGYKYWERCRELGRCSGCG